MGHTKDVSSEEETRQKLENLVVNPINSDGDLDDTNSASATKDEDSKLSAEGKVEIGHSIPDSSRPKYTADASQNSAESDESSKLSVAMTVEIGHSIPNSSLPVDAGQRSASTTTDQASKDPATKKVEIRPFMCHFSCPKDTLIMYAVPPGYIARRQSDGDVWDSSVMLQTLKDVLTDIPEDKSLLAALTEVIGRIARDYEYSPDMTDYDIKQLTEEERRETTLYKIVPVINHRLQYDFYFTKKNY
ncbi:hypothetical protein CHS0354_033120 [Potamilus streckersoni]|uniref:Uncharacterized protein n=1 Tax=Potamilus streckersoni TaxID=2493646 RepID=A0AAE0VPP3_9BIVA|nr:hypothetical protein CHS0354_033120 [Potamilus streckersoni]